MYLQFLCSLFVFFFTLADFHRTTRVFFFFFILFFYRVIPVEDRIPLAVTQVTFSKRREGSWDVILITKHLPNIPANGFMYLSLFYIGATG